MFSCRLRGDRPCNKSSTETPHRPHTKTRRILYLDHHAASFASPVSARGMFSENMWTSSQFDITVTRQASSPTPALPKESILGPDMTKLVAGRTSPMLKEVKTRDYAFDVSLLPEESQFFAVFIRANTVIHRWFQPK